jgi:branched-chain amino acid transport system substrate-binding protein
MSQLSNWRPTLLILALPLLLAAALIYYYYYAAPTETIRIGLIAPATGNASVTGQGMLNSAEMAVRNINSEGGLLVGRKRYTVELIVADDANNPEQATAAAQRLISQDNVVAIIGPPFSRPAIDAARVAEAARVPLISPTATNPEVTLGREYIFRATFLDDLQGYAMARFAWTDLERRRVAVLYDISNSYNRGLAEAFRDAFTALGGEVVAFEGYTPDEADYAPFLLTIRDSGAEALFLPNYTSAVIAQGQLAREMGLEMVFLGSDSWEASLIVPYAEFDGSYYSGHFCRDMTNPRIAAFANQYQAEYGHDINGLIALTYDAIWMVFAAIQDQAEIDPQAIQKGLYNITYDGLAGSIQFNDSGDPEKAVAIWTLQDGDRICHELYSP